MSDLIRREDAIAVLCFSQETGQMVCGDLRKLLEEIKAIPSVEPERKWIPVAEALPKDMDRLLATIVRSDGTKRVRSGNYYKEYFMMDNGDTWNATDKEVLAWMPLPEAWGGEEWSG